MSNCYFIDAIKEIGTEDVFLWQAAYSKVKWFLLLSCLLCADTTLVHTLSLVPQTITEDQLKRFQEIVPTWKKDMKKWGEAKDLYSALCRCCQPTDLAADGSLKPLKILSLNDLSVASESRQEVRVIQTLSNISVMISESFHIKLYFCNNETF